MNIISKLFAANLIALSLIVFSFYMMCHDKPYWGWVLFAALVSGETIR